MNKCRNVKFEVLTGLLLTIQAFRQVTQSESHSKYGHVSEQHNAVSATLALSEDPLKQQAELRP
jgi:hypothetical protein